MEKLIKDSEDFSKYKIAEVVNLDPKTLGIKIEKWYENHSFDSLRALAKAGNLTWEKLTNLSKTEAKVLRGYPANQWIKWIVNVDCANIITEKCNFSKEYLYKNKYSLKLSEVLIGESLKFTNLKKELRKKKTIRLLKENIDSSKIMRYFNIQRTSKKVVISFYNKLFSNEDLTLLNIINKYSKTPKKYLNKYYET
ncbi:MAG: hypothetical protein ACTSV5_08545 [Promethearchaeota archaeon]